MIKYIRAENFLSWETLEFQLDQGVTLLEGFNYDDSTFEGSGKSSIPNALCWGLYGRIPKDAKVDDVIREGAKSCLVEVGLLDGSRISRTRKPNDLFIEEPSGNQIRGSSLKDTQDLIEQKIGMSFEAFCQAVYFAQTYPKKFVTATEKERADIISEIQDLKQFDRARAAAHKALQAKNSALLNEMKDQERRESLFREGVKQYESLIQLLEKFFDDKNRELAQIVGQIENIHNQKIEAVSKEEMEQLSSEIADCDRELEEFYSDKTNVAAEISRIDAQVREQARYASQIKSNRDHLGKSLAKVEKDMSLKKSQLSDFMNAPKKHCPECGSVLDEKHIKKHILETTKNLASLEKEQKELLAQINSIVMPEAESPEDTSELKNLQAQIEREIKNVKARKQEIEKVLTEARRQNEKQSVLKARIKELEKGKDAIEARTADHIEAKISASQKNLDELEPQIEEGSQKIEQLKREIVVLETLKESFPKVKAFIFKTVLDELTATSNRFLKELFDVPIDISFSNRSEDGELSKIEIEVMIEGVNRPLGLYSGGQFKRIELSVDLALSSIISSRSNKPFNLRIFDEPFQGMTSQTMERALNIFQDLRGSTVLIEHNELIKSVVSRVFSIEYRDGISKRVS